MSAIRGEARDVGEPDLAAFEAEVRSRISMTISCPDADHLPRVPAAGTVVTDGDGDVQVMHNGIVVERDGYYGAWMTEIIRCLRGVHEPQEERAFAVVLDRLQSSPARGRETTMLELGSSWAYYSLWFLQEIPTGRAVCLEPDPSNLELGRRNLALNKRTGEFVHGFVGDGRGDGTSAPHIPETGGSAIDIPNHSLESLMREVDLEAVDLLLADIQGVELPLLRAAEPRLRALAVRFLVVSTHDLSISGSATTHQDVLDLVLDCGAHVIAEHSVSESFSGDGLVVASFDPQDADLRVEVSFARSRDSLFGEWEVRYAALHERVDALEAEVVRLRSELDAGASDAMPAPRARRRFRRS